VVFNGKPLADDALLSMAGVEEEQTLQVGVPEAGHFSSGD
jgi:hypothetical protein